MTALNEPRDTPQLGTEPTPSFVDLPLAADTIVYQGGLAMLGDSARTMPGAAGGRFAIGRYEETVDNGGGLADALRVKIRQGVFQFANASGGDAITVHDVGTPCFIVDDQTVAGNDGGGTRPIAGVIVSVDADGVWVEMGLTLGLIVANVVAALAVEAAATIQRGVATLVGGTVTVMGHSLSATSRIMVTRNTPGGTAGHLSAPSASRDVGAGSFVINSSAGADTSTVDYVIVG